MNTFKTVLLACAFAGMAAHASADSACLEPVPPQQPTGKATLKQISDAAHYTNQFMKDSDDYQSCLLSEQKQAQIDAAKAKKDFDPSPWDTKVERNQSAKIKVGQEFQMAFNAFCKANPNADPSCAKH